MNSLNKRKDDFDSLPQKKVKEEFDWFSIGYDSWIQIFAFVNI